MVNRPDSNKARQARHTRVRAKISGTAECPRLNVFRSLQNIYAQLIDDVKGETLVSASTVEKDFEGYVWDYSLSGTGDVAFPFVGRLYSW